MEQMNFFITKSNKSSNCILLLIQLLFKNIALKRIREGVLWISNLG